MGMVRSERLLRLYIQSTLGAFEKYYVKAGFETPFSLYVSYLSRALVAVGAAVFAASLAVHLFLLRFAVPLAFAASVTLTVLAEVLVVFVALYYPVYRVYSRRITIEKDLPFTASYMAALSSSGMGLERLLERAVLYESNKEIKREIALILRDIKAYGLDTLTALSRAALRSPSRSLAMLWLGLRETYITSGNFKSYLSHFSGVLLSEKTQSLRRVTNTISMMAEVYTTLMVAAPLMFVTMLVIMDMLGGTVFGLSPGILVLVLTFVVVPFSALGVYVAIDGILSRV